MATGKLYFLAITLPMLFGCATMAKVGVFTKTTCEAAPYSGWWNERKNVRWENVEQRADGATVFHTKPFPVLYGGCVLPKEQRQIAQRDRLEDSTLACVLQEDCD